MFASPQALLTKSEESSKTAFCLRGVEILFSRWRFGVDPGPLFGAQEGLRRAPVHASGREGVILRFLRQGKGLRLLSSARGVLKGAPKSPLRGLWGTNLFEKVNLS